MGSASVNDFDFFWVFLQGAFQLDDVTGQLTQPVIVQALRSGVLKVNGGPCRGLIERVAVLNRPAIINCLGE